MATANVCEWVSFGHALKHFALYSGPTQSRQHIKALHWYVACRLVIEGGFHPDDITPHPPFFVSGKPGRHILDYDTQRATGAERTVLGGLKTKDVDVVVTKNGIGPVAAISCKGAIGAFRNLTNRMEEAVGDCTNLHITYPAMVCGCLFVLRAYRPQGKLAANIEESGDPAARQLTANDMAMRAGGGPIESILRFHSALRELAGRRGIRDDVSRYEAIALSLVDADVASAGQVLTGFPPDDSPCRIDDFFPSIYARYDERYVYGAPELRARRLAWSPTSPVITRTDSGDKGYPRLEYRARLAG